MARKRTIEELESQILATQKRLEELRAIKSKVTEAQRAKINAEIIAAIHEWQDSEAIPMQWSEVPGYFRELAARNRENANNIHTPAWMND